MPRRTTVTRRLLALSISAVLTVGVAACGSDGSDDSSMPPATTAAPDSPDTTAGDTGGSDTTDPLDPFADVDETELNRYCDAVQAASPLGLDNVRSVAEVAPEAIAAEYDAILAYADNQADMDLKQKAEDAFVRLVVLHQDVCGIPVKFE